MTEFSVFGYQHGDSFRVTRIYSIGHDGNLAAWKEEVFDSFLAIIAAHDDNPLECHPVGEPKHVWIRKKKKYWDIQLNEPPPLTDKQRNYWIFATMIRVHRNNTPGASR